MPYDEGERAWKLNVYDLDGQLAGLLEYACYVRRYGETSLEYLAHRTWRGRPKNGAFETLFTWGPHHTYFLLIGPGADLSEEHYCIRLRPESARQWLEEERYDIPDDLRGLNGNSPDRVDAPLTEAMKAVWDALKGRARTGKELAIELLGDFSAEDTIRKRIAQLRARGYDIRNDRGVGYWRVDAPPDSSRASTEEDVSGEATERESA